MTHWKRRTETVEEFQARQLDAFLTSVHLKQDREVEELRRENEAMRNTLALERANRLLAKGAAA